MDQETLQRILELVGKTGDRVIVTDPAGANPFVVMGLDQYEALVSADTVPKNAPAQAPKSAATLKKPGLRVEEDLDPPVNLKGVASYKGQKKDIPLWKSQPKQEQEKAEKAPEASSQASSPQQGDDTGEERFYLEPLE